MKLADGMPHGGEADVARMPLRWRIRFAVLLMLLALLTLPSFWLMAMNSSDALTPLSFNVSPDDSSRYRQLLVDNGIDAKYDADTLEILVSADKRNDALIVLAQNEMLPRERGGGFEDALKQVDPEESQEITEMRLCIALQNEVGMLLEAFDGVESAKVFYTHREQKPLFRKPCQMRAVVHVRMRQGVTLDEKLADTMVKVVAFARSGLELENVMLTDRQGYHYQYGVNLGVTDEYIRLCNPVVVAGRFVKKITPFFVSFGGRMKNGFSSSDKGLPDYAVVGAACNMAVNWAALTGGIL